MRNVIFILLGFGIITSTLSCQPNTSYKQKISWSDSVSVKTYVENSTLCEKLNLANDSIDLFATGEGFSIKVLESISKETHEHILIPIARGNIIVTDMDRNEALKEQIEKIYKKHCK